MLGQGPFGRPNLAALADESGLLVTTALFPSQAVVHSPIMVNFDNIQLFPMNFDSSALTVFPAPAIVAIHGLIVPEKFDNTSVFYGFAVDHELVLYETISQIQFYAPTIGIVATQVVAPELVSSGNQFLAPFVDTQFKFIEPLHYDSTAFIHRLTVTRPEAEYVYDYPIGSDLESDYGLRASMTFYKQRLVLGHRYGHRSR